MALISGFLDHGIGGKIFTEPKGDTFWMIPDGSFGELYEVKLPLNSEQKGYTLKVGTSISISSTSIVGKSTIHELEAKAKAAKTKSSPEPLSLAPLSPLSLKMMEFPELPPPLPNYMEDILNIPLLKAQKTILESTSPTHDPTFDDPSTYMYKYNPPSAYTSDTYSEHKKELMEHVAAKMEQQLSQQIKELEAQQKQDKSSPQNYTQEEITAAFTLAPSILNILKAAGVANPRIELFADGSGKITLGPANTITSSQKSLANSLVNGIDGLYNGVYATVSFTNGLLEAAKTMIKSPKPKGKGIKKKDKDKSEGNLDFLALVEKEIVSDEPNDKPKSNPTFGVSAMGGVLGSTL